MAEIILDLSGKSGLANNFYGDADTVTPLPNLRITEEPGQIVQGLFNPYLRTGYLAPVTTTNVDLTLDSAATSHLHSVEFDYVNQLVYWGDTANKIYVGSGLNDTSLLLEANLDFTSGAPQKFFRLSDLQIYQINGVPKLFYSGVGSHVHSTVGGNDYPEVKIATIPSANDSAWTAVSINPSGTTKPAVVASVRDFNAASSSTLTTSVTVPSGSNLCVTVITYNSSGSTVTGITFNGNAMTSVAGSAGAASGVAVYRFVAPSAGTFNVVTTYSASSANRLNYIIVTDNTDQTNPVRATTDADPDDVVLIANKRIISDNQITFFSAYSDEVLTSLLTSTVSLFNTTNSYGSDFLLQENSSGMYWQIGYADLPLTTVAADQAAWISASAVGGGLEIVYTDHAFLRVADNGFMYAFADNKVHKIDGSATGGANGTITRNVLLFPDYFRITDAVDYRSRLYIAIHQYPVTVTDTTLNTFSGRCGLYVWNRISTQLSSADYIELPGVREIKKIFSSPDGQLKLITINDNGLVELRQFGYNDSGGVVFPVVKTMGIGAYPQVPDGLTIGGDKVYWMANDGKIYCNKDNVVTNIYQAKAPGTTTATLESNVTSGAIFYGSGNETGSTGFRSNKQAISYSYNDGGTHVFEKIYPFDLKTGADATQTPAQGDVYTGVTLLPSHSVVRNVRIYNAPTTGTGTTALATIKLYFNQSTTVGMTKTISLSEASRGYVDFKINKPYIHAIQVEIEWSTSIALSGTLYLPSAAVITYDITEAQSPDNG